MINLYATDSLTLVERAELERFVSGPITEQHIKDKIAGRERGAYAPEEKTADEIRAERTRHLETASRWAAKVASYRDLLGTWASQSYCEQEIDFYSRLFREAMDRADACDRLLDAMTAPHQIAAE